MAKKLSKKQRLLQQCEASYEIAQELLGLSPTDDSKEQVRKLVFAANDILTEICQNADKIKIDLFEEVGDIVPIDKTRWTEFVSLSARENVSEDILQKYEEKFQESQYIINLRAMFINTRIRNGSEAQFPDKDRTEVQEVSESDTYSSEEFDRILEDAVEVRRYINGTLWPSFRQLWEAAAHVTKLALTYKEFKDLVDWEHYRHGGYPNENSKPKLWSIINRFDYALRLMKYFEFPQIDTLLKKFGLDIEMSDHHATVESFTDSSDILARYTIYRPENEEARKSLRMLTDELLIRLTDGGMAIFDRDTRVIRAVITYSPEYGGITTERVRDSGEYLVLDEVTHKTLLPYFLKHDIRELLHPQNITVPNKSKRKLSDEEIELLGEGGYYPVNEIIQY